MSIRTDSANLIVTINAAQAANTLQDMEKHARDLRRMLSKMPVDSAEFKAAAAELQKLDTRIKQTKASMTALRQEGAGAGASVGGFFGSIAGKVTLAMGAVQAALATLQGVFQFAKDAVISFNEGAKADAALASRIESTGAAAGRTLEQLKTQARDLQEVTLFDDEQTKKGQEILLTFTNIKNEIFDQAIPAAQDLSTVFDQDLKSSAVQLGKALNDPVRGVTALRRVGISFSESQEEMIRKLVETNRVAEAQAIILQEVQREVGGAARAAAEAGTGPYQILQNRFGEVQEQVGELISQGLEKLRPAFEVVVKVLGKVTEAMLSGKRASGEYSGAANFIVVVLEAIGKTLGFLGDLWNIQVSLLSKVASQFMSVGSAIGRAIDTAKNIPVLGVAIRVVADIVGVLKDLFESLPATMAGFQAAASQAVQNIKGFFTGLVSSAKILAKELELSLTINGDSRAQLFSEIQALKAEQQAAASGKTIGQAYTDARNAVMEKGDAEIAEQQKSRQKVTDQELQRQAEAAARELSERRSAVIEAAEKRRKEQIELALREIDIRFAKEELAALKLKNDGIIRDELTFSNVMIQLEQQQLQARLTVYRRYGQEQVKEAIDLQKKLAEIEGGRGQTKTEELDTLPGIETGEVTSQTGASNTAGLLASLGGESSVLKTKFAQIVDMEMDHQLRISEIRRNSATERLRVLTEQGHFENAAYKEALDAKFAADTDFNKKVRENDEKTAEFKSRLLNETYDFFQDSISLGLELLMQDEGARKKNAGAIKAFQIAQVQIAGITEIAKIWENAAAFGPFQSVIAGVQSALALGRTALAISKINNAKFAGGGFTGPGFGIVPDSTGHRPVGVVHANEWVSPPWMTNHPTFGPQIRALEQVRQRGFADGGFATTPTVNVVPGAAIGSATPQSVEMFGALASEFRQFRNEVAGWQSRLRVSYADIEEVGGDMSKVRTDAQI